MAPNAIPSASAQQRLRRQQRDMMAGGAIHLYEIARPEILYPRGVEGEHPSGLHGNCF